MNVMRVEHQNTAVSMWSTKARRDDQIDVQEKDDEPELKAKSSWTDSNNQNITAPIRVVDEQ